LTESWLRDALWSRTPVRPRFRSGVFFRSGAGSRVCALIIAALGILSCRYEPQAATKPDLVGWRPIASWSGHGDAQTDSFNIESGQLRIKWATSNENPAGAGTFRVTVHSAVSGRPLTVAVEHRGDGRGIAYVNEDPRLFHLVIESRSVDWSIAVEESVIGKEQGSR
jgi:hypothetical protein